jgi:predicted DNA repair protein MutK
VLGDDLALNADQVRGVSAERELPVVWAVAKGSFLNKLLLVPAALAITSLLPVMMIILLVIGGLYLCFEGAEKVLHRFLPQHTDEQKAHTLRQLADDSQDIVALEKQKIKGAIRTDFILSAEIIVISLGTMADKSLTTQFVALSLISVLFTVGVYGLVAALLKMDDAGLYLLRASIRSQWQLPLRMTGRALLVTAPALMKVLTLAGTIAMFLVGGGLLSHNIPALHHLFSAFSENLLLTLMADAVVGFVAGAMVVGGVTFYQYSRSKSI